MSFDDDVREGLTAAERSYQAPPPHAEALAANVQHRRRRKMQLAGGGAAAVAVLVGLSIVLSSIDPAPTTNLSVAGRGPGTTADGAPPAGSRDDPSATTSSSNPAHTSPTAANGGIAPAGTAYAPPGSVVHPAATTTTMPRPTTTAPPASGDTITVTQDDNGKTFTLRPGQHLVVSLHESGYIWSDPDTDNSAVLTRTAVSANPSADRVTASFDAKRAGQAHVSASKDLPCRNSTPPCMAPTQLWQITVNVS